MSPDDKQQTFTASANAIAVLRLNPGLNVDAAALRAIQAGTLVTVGTGAIAALPAGRLVDFGCIATLRYKDGDQDLERVEFDNGDVLGGPHTYPQNCNNLNDFRERLQEAANFGFGVTGCLDTTKKRLFMLNLYPCRCKCKCDSRD